MDETLRAVTHIENIRLGEGDDTVVIIDQTELPSRSVYLTLQTAEEMYEAILKLRVRGAPAIGICAAYCMYVLARRLRDKSLADFRAQYTASSDYLNAARPTAVNLSWALRRMAAVVDSAETVAGCVEALGDTCRAIHAEDIAMCLAISEHGLSLLTPGQGVITHCNAGPLATSRYGTALGPLLLGRERGIPFKVFVDETRPLLQGARLTAYELHSAGIDTTLICDNMASLVMRNGWVSACLVGCDRVAANGDTANKIGTSGLAILAKHYGIPFYVLGPTSTLDLTAKTGDDIEIELRDPDEIRLGFYKEPMAPRDVPCYNPAFDITDHSLITAIITEKGICYPPFVDTLRGQ